MIIVQAIHTQWSKAARGAPRAARRNTVPTERPLNRDFRQQSGNLLFQYSAFTETDDFSEPVEEFTRVHELSEGLLYRKELVRPHAMKITLPHSTARHVETNPETIEIMGFSAQLGKQLIVTDHVAPSAGSRQALQLCKGEWGQIQHNRRLSVDAGTLYESLTMNVAFTDSIEPDIFMNSIPNRKYVRQNRLY